MEELSDAVPQRSRRRGQRWPGSVSRAPGAWIEDAACARTDPPLRDVFTQEAPSGPDLRAALRVCRSCPVVAACGAYGREIRGYGRWGGHLLRNGREVAQRGHSAA